MLHTRLHEYYIAEWVGKNKVAYLAGVTLVPGGGVAQLRWRTVHDVMGEVFHSCHSDEAGVELQLGLADAGVPGMRAQRLHGLDEC